MWATAMTLTRLLALATAVVTARVLVRVLAPAVLALQTPRR
jgi:hypothetical protein